ncbi:MAG: TrkH family potassium uptake protein [Nitrospinae bacterium]|nr:TrkH family potassium uptake protein [Nitrospinota bacterium]
MNVKAILNVIGILLVLFSGLLLLPIGIALYYHRPAQAHYLNEIDAFSLTFSISCFLGLCFWRFFPSGIEKLRDREGFAIVAFSWIVISLFGALPFYLTGACPWFVDAFFESVSGFTTTGASVLKNIDSLPRGILFWRSLMHWVGGMGIIMLSLAIFPMMGISGFHLFKESGGATSVERMQPRLAETAKTLWKAYVVLTLLEVVFLRFGGMSYFDAICHAFGTVSTGGFSTHQDSVNFFKSAYIEGVIIVFMFLGGINFALHYQMLRGDFKISLKNPELQFYVYWTASIVALTTWVLWLHSDNSSLAAVFRKAVFTVVSIQSTTGFVTDDFNRWPDSLRILMVVLMIMGACTGSTCGALKIFRIQILLKNVLRELQKLARPRAVIPLRVGAKTVEPEMLSNVFGFVGLYLAVLVASALFLIFLGVEPEVAISGTAATLGGVGPGLGAVGAAGDFSGIPFLGKWALILCMLMGRLEIYGVVLLFLPMAWKK